MPRGEQRVQCRDNVKIIDNAHLISSLLNIPAFSNSSNSGRVDSSDFCTLSAIETEGALIRVYRNSLALTFRAP